MCAKLTDDEISAKLSRWDRIEEKGILSREDQQEIFDISNELKADWEGLPYVRKELPFKEYSSMSFVRRLVNKLFCW